MSDDLWVADPETEHRRRAVWGLAVLALIAVIIIALMAFLLGSGGGGGNNDQPNANDIPLNPTAGSTAQTSQQSAPNSSGGSTPRSTPPSTPKTSASTTATTSCSSGSSCTLEGDAGKVIDAINSLRTTNGQSAVPGTTTDEAKTCSLNNGGGGCPSSYFWEPVSPQDGKAVVSKILDKSDGRSFLLDPSMKSLQIGWAFVGGMYSCTVVAVT